MKEYQVAVPTGVCYTTGRAFTQGEEFYSVLMETPQTLERRDFCRQVWTDPPPDCLCFWKSRLVPKEEKKRLFVDNDVLINLFQRLEDAQEEPKRHFRFVLALLLMRKRLLKYEERIQDGPTEWWIMRLVEDQQLYRVINPRLTDPQVQAVSRELGAILHGDPQSLEELNTAGG